MGTNNERDKHNYYRILIKEKNLFKLSEYKNYFTFWNELKFVGGEKKNPMTFVLWNLKLDPVYFYLFIFFHIKYN